jgi:plasmid maintenance system antidote protein VapI
MRLDIKLAIVKSGRPQYVIAQELGVPESTLSKFVRGYGALRPEQEQKLTEMLGLQGEGLERGEGDYRHAAHAI